MGDRNAPSWVLILVALIGAIGVVLAAVLSRPQPNLTQNPSVPIAVEAAGKSTSTSPQACVIPYVERLDQNAAEIAIAQLGLQIVKSTDYNAEIASGLVLSQDPPAGNKLSPCKGEVFVVISLGPVPTPIPPAPTFTSTPAPPIVMSLPIATDTPQPTDMPLPLPTSATPVIDDVVLRVENNTDGKLLHQDIHFHDVDGDAYIVIYELISSTRAGIRVENDSITATSSEQKTGAIVTGTWHCKTGSYIVVLRATVLDKAGNKSNPKEIEFDCR